MWRILIWLFFFLLKYVSSGFIESQTRSSSCTGSLSFHHYHTEEFITKITDTSLRIVLSSGRNKVKIKLEGNCCFYVFNRKNCRGQFVRTSKMDSLRPSSHMGEISAVKTSSWENGCRKNQSMVKKICKEKIKDSKNIEKLANHARQEQEQVVVHHAREIEVTNNEEQEQVVDYPPSEIEVKNNEMKKVVSGATDPIILEREVKTDEIEIFENTFLNVSKETEEEKHHIVEFTEIKNISIDEKLEKVDSDNSIPEMVSQLQDQDLKKVESNSEELPQEIGSKIKDQEFKKVENVTYKIEETAVADNITKIKVGNHTSIEEVTKVEENTMILLDESNILNITMEDNIDKTAAEVNNTQEVILERTTESALYTLNTTTEVIIKEGLHQQNYGNERIINENTSGTTKTQESSTIKNGDFNSTELVTLKQEITRIRITDEETTIKTKTTPINNITNLISEELDLTASNISDINITQQEESKPMIEQENIQRSKEFFSTHIGIEENNVSNTSEYGIEEKNNVKSDTNKHSYAALILEEETIENITEENINCDMSNPLSESETLMNDPYDDTENPSISYPSIELVTKNITGTQNNFENTEPIQPSLNSIGLTTIDNQIESGEITTPNNYTDPISQALKISEKVNKVGKPPTSNAALPTEGNTNIENNFASISELDTTNMKNKKIEESKYMEVENDEIPHIKEKITHFEMKNSKPSVLANMANMDKNIIIENTNDQQDTNFVENYKENTEDIFAIEDASIVYGQQKEVQDINANRKLNNVTFNTLNKQEENIRLENTTINQNTTDVINYKNTYNNITYRKYKRIDENMTDPRIDMKTKIEEKETEKLQNTQNINPVQNDESIRSDFLINATDNKLENVSMDKKPNYKNNSEGKTPIKKESLSEYRKDTSETINHKFNKPQSFSSNDGTSTLSKFSVLSYLIIFYTLFLHCFSYFSKYLSKTDRKESI